MTVRSHSTVSKWTPDHCRQAFELALLGATDKDIAKVFGIDILTLDNWKRDKEEFSEALREGKLKADARVAHSLYQRAVGMEIDEDHVSVFKGEAIVTRIKKILPPDVTAAVRWLEIRQRAIWANVQRVETTETHININKIDFSGLTDEELMLVRKVGLLQISEHASDNSN